jgi:hypothetical protein
MSRELTPWQAWACYVIGLPLVLVALLSPVGALLLWGYAMAWFWGYGARRGLRWWRLPASRRRAIRQRQRLAQQHHRELTQACAQHRLARLGLLDTPANRIALLNRGGR